MTSHSEELAVVHGPVDVVVIGAGIGGLFAAAKLAREGKRVLVAEQHFVVGGYATTFRRGAYTFEAGLHAIDGMFDPENPNLDMFREFGLFESLDFIRLPELYAVRRGDFRFMFPDTYDKAEDALVKKFPADEKAIRKLIGLIKKLRREVMKFPTTGTHPLVMIVNMALAPFRYPAIVTSLFKSIGGYLAQSGMSEECKLAFTANTGYYHDDPYDYSMLHFGAAQSSYIAGGGSYIRGGSQKLSDRMAAIIVEAGGTILLSHLVKEIYTENGRVSGVRLLDKKSERESRVDCRVVVANAAIPEVMEGLLPPVVSEKLRARYGSYDISHSIFCLYLGLKKPLSSVGVDSYSTFILPESLKTLDDMAEGNKTTDFAKKILALVDYGQVDAGHAEGGRTTAVCAVIDEVELWEGLSKGDYAARKDRLSRILLDRLEKEYPGISDCVEYMEAATPTTMRRYTLNPRGCVYGYAQSARQVGPRRPDNRSPVPGLYFASAWSKPGGGISAAAKCGYLTAGVVLKDMKQGKH